MSQFTRIVHKYVPPYDQNIGDNMLGKDSAATIFEGVVSTKIAKLGMSMNTVLLKVR